MPAPDRLVLTAHADGAALAARVVFALDAGLEEGEEDEGRQLAIAAALVSRARGALRPGDFAAVAPCGAVAVVHVGRGGCEPVAEVVGGRLLAALAGPVELGDEEPVEVNPVVTAVCAEAGDRRTTAALIAKARSLLACAPAPTGGGLWVLSEPEISATAAYGEPRGSQTPAHGVHSAAVGR